MGEGETPLFSTLAREIFPATAEMRGVLDKESSLYRLEPSGQQSLHFLESHVAALGVLAKRDSNISPAV